MGSPRSIGGSLEAPHHELKGRPGSGVMFLASHIQWPGCKHKGRASDLTRGMVLPRGNQ